MVVCLVSIQVDDSVVTLVANLDVKPVAYLVETSVVHLDYLSVVSMVGSTVAS